MACDKKTQPMVTKKHTTPPPPPPKKKTKNQKKKNAKMKEHDTILNSSVSSTYMAQVELIQTENNIDI